MSADDITFGVEIETTLPAGALAVGPHGRGCDIPQLPGWKADRDPSIRAGAGHEACEFVSPVFKGSEGLKQLLRDLATIRALGARVGWRPRRARDVAVGAGGLLRLGAGEPADLRRADPVLGRADALRRAG